MKWRYDGILSWLIRLPLNELRSTAANLLALGGIRWLRFFWFEQFRRRRALAIIFRPFGYKWVTWWKWRCWEMPSKSLRDASAQECLFRCFCFPAVGLKWRRPQNNNKKNNNSNSNSNSSRTINLCLRIRWSLVDPGSNVINTWKLKVTSDPHQTPTVK